MFVFCFFRAAEFADTTAGQCTVAEPSETERRKTKVKLVSRDLNDHINLSYLPILLQQRHKYTGGKAGGKRVVVKDPIQQRYAGRLMVKYTCKFCLVAFKRFIFRGFSNYKHA